MKSLIIFSSVIILSTIFLPFTSCDLIDTTCKQTPNSNLCLSLLKSNPKSRNADITGLSLIMVDAVKGKVITILEAINKLEKSSPSPSSSLKKALAECRERHDTILKADVVVAIEALQKGDPKFAVDGMNDAAIEAHICEESFKPKGSPFSKLNKDVIDTSLVAAAVMKNLL